MTLKRAILVTSIVGVFYFAWAFYQGVRLQLSGFYSDFAKVVNSNLLWEISEGYSIGGKTWCAPGNGPDWPKERSQCVFVGGAIAGCSVLTFGRSCAVIGVPKTYFDNAHFRESLRVALSNLCAVFNAPKRARQPYIYFTLGCGGNRSVSLSVYIDVMDIAVEPPYNIEIRSSPATLLTRAYFSAWTHQITMISEHPK
jgi:hypothetical protein